MVTTKLKTLKDFREPKEEEVPYTGEWAMGVNDACDGIKAEAIKWVKKDITDTPSRNKDAWALIFRWMDRFNITNEDLK